MRIDKCAKCQNYHPKGFDYCPKRHADRKSFSTMDDAIKYFIDGEAIDRESSHKPKQTDTAPQIEKAGQRTNADRERERQAQKRAENREEYNARIKRWRDENREYVRARQREYMEAYRQRRK